MAKKKTNIITIPRSRIFLDDAITYAETLLIKQPKSKKKK